MFSSTLPCPRTTPWSLPALPRWLRPTQELRIDVQSPSATPQSDELESLYKRLHRRRDALFGASVLELPLPGLRVYCREADGEFYLYVEDVQAQCLAGYTVFNRLVEVDRRTDRHLRAPHTKVAHGYRRMGIATAIYRWWLDSGRCLMTGARQSAGAHGLWMALARDYELAAVRIDANKRVQQLPMPQPPGFFDALDTRLVLVGRDCRLADFTQPVVPGPHR